MILSFALHELGTHGQEPPSREMIQNVMVGMPVTDKSGRVVGKVIDIHGNMATAEVDDESSPAFEEDGSVFLTFNGRPRGPQPSFPSLERGKS